MPDLLISVDSVHPAEGSDAPGLLFGLRIRNTQPGEIRSISLHCQLQIQPGRRCYNPSEQKKLEDLFGGPERWSTTVRPMFWANSSTTVSQFHDGTIAHLLVPCPLEFQDGAAKYFCAIEEGDIPVLLLFSGTILHISPEGLRMKPIPRWQEATCRVPSAVWQQMMAAHYSGIRHAV